MDEKTLKEALKMRRAIHCQFIVRLCGIVNENNEKGIVMEYIKNGNLKKFLIFLEGGCWPRCVHMIRDIASGLSHMHGLDPPLVHRDIKLSNIMIDGSYTAKEDRELRMPMFYLTFCNILHVTHLLLIC